MNKIRTSLIAAAAAGLVAIPALAAQPHGGPGMRHVEGDITLADVEARSAEHFAKLDADGNGLVTSAEMDAAREARHERRAERMEQRGERAKQHMERRGEHRGQRHEQRFARMDGNGDGALSLAEFQARPLAMFERADADKNGILTEAERAAARDTVRERRHERRQQRSQ
ncbi:EF-hand domain-containing protein [Sphingomicrobium arenosum]|uniref:EF-hand domain-containing protein n=1 Tax=Sphingomicrobium arenosum TaxID=2233861 RepID=UPI002240FA90|nr:hypothetical protein [Sphingomicrobium arenosum]